MALDLDRHLAATSQKPAVRPKTQVAVRDVDDPWAAAPPAERQRVQEILRFLDRIDFLKTDGAPQNDADAVAWILRNEAGRYPALHVARTARGRDTLLSVRNAVNWRAQLGRTRSGDVDKGNYAALLSTHGRGQRRRKGSDEWWSLFYGLYWSGNKEARKEAYRDACRQWRGCGLPERGVPKWPHVRYWDDHYGDRYVRDYARNGETWHRTHACGYIVRDADELKVGELWIADHRKMDFLARGEKADGTPWPMRVWMTMFKDAKSGKVMSYRLYGTWDDEPNAIAIIQTFWDAVQRHGLPNGVYFDNGKDFCKMGFATPLEINGREYAILDALGVTLIRAIKFNARAKSVERTFLNCSEHCDRKFPSYIGNSPGNRPEKAWENARANVDRLPTIDQVLPLVQDWIYRYENDAETHSRISGRRPPQEMWDARTPWRTQLPADTLRAAMILPTSATRLVRGGPEGPSVEYECAWYSSQALQEDGKLWGRTVRVWEDPLAETVVRDDRDVPSRVIILTEDCTPIGDGIASVHGMAPYWARSEEGRELVGDKIAEQRRRLGRSKSQFRSLTGLPKPISPAEVVATFAVKKGVAPATQPDAKGSAETQQKPERRPGVSADSLARAHAVRHGNHMLDGAGSAPDRDIRGRLASLRNEHL